MSTTGLFPYSCWLFLGALSSSVRLSLGFPIECAPHDCLPLSHPIIFPGYACERWSAEAGWDGQTAGDRWPAPGFWHQPFQPEGKWWMPQANFKTPWTKFFPTSEQRWANRAAAVQGASRRRPATTCVATPPANPRPWLIVTLVDVIDRRAGTRVAITCACSDTAVGPLISCGRQRPEWRLDGRPNCFIEKNKLAWCSRFHTPH